MNREIKFRAWDGKRMLLSEDGDFYLMENGDVEIPSSTGHEFYRRQYPLMQFTGLKDKNGVEIYEGDIVNYAVKKMICPVCSQKEHESQLDYGISRFCPDCGKGLTDSDFITPATVEFRNGGFAYYKEPTENYYQSWQTQVAAIYLAWVEVTGNIHQSSLQTA